MAETNTCARCARHPGWDCAGCLKKRYLAAIVAEREKGRLTADQADLARGNLEEEVAARRLWEEALERHS